MMTFDPPDLREKIIAAIESLSDVVEVEWEVVSSDDFDPAKFDDEIISKDTVIENLGLTASQEPWDITVGELLECAKEVESATLIDSKEFRSPNLTLIYVEAASEYTFRNSEGIANRFPSLEQKVNIDGIKYVVDIVQGLTPFAFPVAREGSCGDLIPSCTESHTFIRVAHSGGDQNTIATLINAFLFELSSSIGLVYSMTSLPQELESDEGDEAGEVDEEDSVIRLRPILHGAGIRELMELYNEAATVANSEYSVLGFTKVIEYVAATVVKQHAHQIVRTRLLSPEALRPNARFIEELLNLIEEQRTFQRDSEAIRLTVETCCDAIQLARHAPPCLAQLIKISSRSKAEQRKEALQKMAECISATRNQIVHAKTNFTPKGAECPLDQISKLADCLRVASHQVIRWFADVPEDFRVLK